MSGRRGGRWLAIVAVVGIASCARWAPRATVPTAAPTIVAGTEGAEDLNALIAAHNEQRARAGLRPLVPESRLMEVAAAHAADMAVQGRMSHRGGDGSNPFERLERRGYLYHAAGENVAAGQRGAAEVMDAWMSSRPHRRNVLGGFDELGVGLARGPDGTPYWCAVFADPLGPSTVLPTVAAVGLIVQDPAPETKAEAEVPERIVRLVEAHNAERAKQDLPPLEIAPKLMAAAEAHARDMAGHAKMSHEGSDGSSPTDRIRREEYHFENAGENVASGQVNVEEAMNSWMNSEQHRANILSPKFTEIGAAVAAGEDGIHYWCVDFGKPYPQVEPGEAAEGIARAINAGRSAEGRPPVSRDARLEAVAQDVADGMAERGALKGDEQAGLAGALREAGYRYRSIALSAARGQATAEEVVQGWLANESNRSTVLGDFDDVGTGYATDTDGAPYWVVIFGKPAGR